MTTPPREFQVVADVSSLPSGAIGARHLVWWGNIGFMVIEGTGFALAAAAYLYLMTQSPTWPPAGDALPGLLWSGIFTAALALSTVPNLWVLRCARAKKAAAPAEGEAEVTEEAAPKKPRAKKAAAPAEGEAEAAEAPAKKPRAKKAAPTE